MAFSNENYDRIFPTSNMVRPHVETNYNADALGGQSSDSEKHIAIIGSATNGEPNRVYELDSLMEAKQIFGSGDIVDACQVIWSPNKKYLGGGGTVYAMRVETATQAILNAPALRFQSKVWGEQANKTQVALEQSNLDNSYYVTIDYAPDNYHKVYRNLGQLFKLQYKANSKDATATYSVVKDSKSGLAKKFVLDIKDSDKKDDSGTGTLNPTTTTTTMKLNTTTTTTSTTVNVAKDVTTDSSLLQSGDSATSNTESNVLQDEVSGDIPTPESVSTSTTAKGVQVESEQGEAELHTIHQEFDLTQTNLLKVYGLMHQLSLIPNLEVQMLVDGDNTRILSNTLDEATDVDILGDINDPDTAGYVWALRSDIVDKLAYDPYVSVKAVYTEDMSLPFGLSNMVHGSTGDVPLSWADQLQALAQTDSYYVVPLTSSSAIHQEVKEFVVEESLNGHPMRAFVGAGFDEGIGNLISRQVDLKSDRVSLIGTSGYFETYDGVTLHLSGYMVAALAAGVASGLQIGGDITNKYVNMLSVDQNFTSAQIDQLYQNGIIVIEPINNRGTTSGFRFVAGITTYNSTNEPVKNKIGLGEITDFLFGDLRVELEKKFVGINVKVGSADIIKSFIVSFLLKESKDPDGLIVDYDESSIAVQIDGNTAWIAFTVKPSQTLDYLYVYGAYDNYTESSTSSGASASNGTSSENVLYGDTSDIPTTGNTDIKKSKNPDINAGYGFSGYEA